MAAALPLSLDAQLMEAVAMFDLPLVCSLLASGADPDYRSARDDEDPHIQPTTPLRMVMFRISDCLLSDEDILVFAQIARVLLDAGADPEPAMQIADERYGPCQPEDLLQAQPPSPFQQVYTIVAQAAAAQHLQQQQDQPEIPMQ